MAVLKSRKKLNNKKNWNKIHSFNHRSYFFWNNKKYTIKKITNKRYLFQFIYNLS